MSGVLRTLTAPGESHSGSRLPVGDAYRAITTKQSRFKSWRTGGSSAVLSHLSSERVNLVCWRRELPAGFERHIVDWVREREVDFDEVISPSSYELGRAIDSLAEHVRSWLIMDVALLVARFAQLTSAPRLRLVVKAVRTDQCRKFHIDYARYRMVSTYGGPGTEWIPDHAVRREVLDEEIACYREANSRILRRDAALQRAKAGDVLVMKGARHQNCLAAVHRSPPIEGTGHVRLVLTVTTVDP